MSEVATSLGVLLDGARLGDSDGEGRAVRELAWALDRHAPGIDLTVLTTPRGATIARPLLVRARVEVADARPLPLWEQVTVPAVARRLGVSVVHFTRETAAWTWPRTATVVTLGDRPPDAPVPAGLPLVARAPYLYRRWTWQAVGRQAAGLISDDEVTAALLQYRCGLHVTVVPTSVESFAERHPPATDRATSPRRYLLHCVDGSPEANTARVVDAWLALRDVRPELSLEIVGLAQTPAAVRGVPGVHVRGRLDDASLAQLYRGAAAVVAPRLDGRDVATVLAGFAFGVPVVASARADASGGSGESGGFGASGGSGGAGAVGGFGGLGAPRHDGALRVDPTSTAAIVAAIASILDDPMLRQRLRVRGGARLEHHGARRVATTLTDLYRRLVLATPPAFAPSTR